MNSHRAIAVAAGIVAALLYSPAAESCSCAYTFEHSVQSANSIVLAKIGSTKYRASESPFAEIEAHYTVIEVIKGASAPVSDTVTEPLHGLGSCAIPLMAGLDFVLFMDPSRIVSSCNGSFAYSERDGKAVALLQRRRELVETPR